MSKYVTTGGLIRHYVINMLSDEVDVGERVYANRPTSPLFLEELPAVCVYYGDFSSEVIAGSKYLAKERQVNQTMVVTVAVEDILDPSEDVTLNQKGEDYLDYLAEQVKRAFNNDWRLAKRLPDFDANVHTPGLTYGNALVGGVSYDVETKSERRVIAKDLRYVLPYVEHAYLDLRLPDFETYYSAIVRVGSDDETIDRVLLAAEGDLQ